MIHEPPRGKENRAWIAVVSWTALIYFAIPLARTIQRWVGEHFGRGFFLYVVFGAIVAGTVLAVARWRRARTGRSPGRIAWLLLVAAIYAALTWHLRGNPEEAFHFVEYGVLGLLLFRALAFRMRDPLIFAVAALIGMLIGTGDEILQWITPRRVFAFRDIGINVAAVVLMQAALALGFRPAYIGGSAPAPSIRRAARLAMGLLILLGLCLANTPARLEAYTRRLPALSFLRHTYSMMAEYGYRHEDPEAGVFLSRFSRAQLEQVDRTRAADVAARLDAFREPELYEEFLRTWTPLTDPFAHEARVHLFRRDRLIQEGRGARGDEQAFRWFATAAWSENRVLEKYFGRTLQASGYVLGPKRLSQLERLRDPGVAYISPVSEHLITGLTEGQWRGIILMAWLAVWLAERGALRRARACGGTI